jgi:hypothetical protein
MNYTITADAVTVIINGAAPFVIPRTAPHARVVIEGIHNGASDEELRKLCSPVNVVQTYSNGRVQIIQDEVLIDNTRVPKCIEDKLIALMRDGRPFAYLVTFLNRLQANPSNRAVEELYRFLEHEGLPITDKGTFLAYKGVRSDRFSVHGNTNTRVISGRVDVSGRIWNGDGQIIAVNRADVDDNCNRTCSHGLHVGSHEYAAGFGDTEIIVEVDPADVVSIPSDCDGQKARVCKYVVRSAARGLMNDSAAAAGCPYAAYDPDPDPEPEDELLFTQADLDDARAEGKADGYDDGYDNGKDAGKAEAVSAFNAAVLSY